MAPHSLANPFLALAQFGWSLGAVLYYVNGISLNQAMTPERILGRVNASRRFIVVFLPCVVGRVVLDSHGGRVR